MGKHSVYHASGEPDGHRRTGVRFGITENTVDPPRLPRALEDKLSELPIGPVRDEFIRGVARIGFEIGVEGLTPHQLDIIHYRAAQDVAAAETRTQVLRRKTNTRPARDGAVVYYIRFAEDAVKIGTSTNVHHRLRTMYRRPEDLIVTEPGDQRLEALRHKQFAADKIDWPGSREVFRLSPELQSHLDMLIKHQANPAA